MTEWPVDLTPATLSQLDARIRVPRYDRAALTPSIVHIGVGGFHRGHFATYIDDLAAAGHTDWGIAGTWTLPGDHAIAEALAAQDGLFTVVARDEGVLDAQVIGSIVRTSHASPDPEPLVARIADPVTAVVSLTVTEGGYPVDDETGAFAPDSPNAAPDSAFAAIVRGLRRRHDAGAGPLTIISFDNIIGNGTVSRTATLGLAQATDPGLVAYIEAQVSFPNSMVDRIVPMTTDTDRAFVAEELGVRDRWPVMTEPFRQWVVEDRFAGPRLPLEELDVIVTDDVEPYELFKLRLLNASHSSLAYLARLVDLELVDHVLADDAFARFVRRFLEVEAGPTVPRTPGIELVPYQASLLRRFANPAIGDQVDRLCQDGSSKFPKFLLPTVRTQLERGGPIELATLALAGWCQYLVGTSESGLAIPHAVDPRLDEARRFAAASVEDPAAFLGFAAVFGEDLPQQERFRTAFVEALEDLRRVGARASIRRALMT